MAKSIDYSWLHSYPSLLLWVDKLLVTKEMWKDIKTGFLSHGKNKELGKCAELFFEKAQSKGIIEIVEPLPVITSKNLKDIIGSQIQKDITFLETNFPKRVSKQDLSKSENSHVVGITIDDIDYCWFHLWIIYSSLIFSRIWDANCFFNDVQLHYCKYKFLTSGIPETVDLERIKSFENIFNMYFPNESVLPEYALIDKDNCQKCKKLAKCKDTYLSAFEDNIEELLSWRDYDEIQQLKGIINTIISKRNDINSDEILKEFCDSEMILRNRVLSIFPKAKRWANVSTMLSIPIAVFGLASGASLLTVAGAGMAGLSHFTKEMIELLESKYRWVTFLPTIQNKINNNKSNT